MKAAETGGTDLNRAKQEVLALVDQGVTYRKIAKRAFVVDGGKKRFSIAQISRWVKERAGNNGEDEGSIASKAFELFERRCKPVRVVIALRQKPDLVKRLYEEWAGMKEALLIPKKVKEEIFEMVNYDTSYNVYNSSSLKEAVEKLVSDYLKLCRFNYPCNVCGKTLFATPENEWKWILEKGYMSTWSHTKCQEQQR